MKIFVYEYLSSGAVPGLAPSLRHEGRAMLTAILADLASLPGIEPVTLLGPAEAPFSLDIQEVRDSEPDEAGPLFDRLAAAADRTLVIAPECAGILVDRCRRVEAVGGRLLGPAVAAVALTSDKVLLAGVLAEHGVPTPPCLLVPDPAVSEVPFPAVLKPRDGAGSQATFLVETAADLPRCVTAARAEWPGPLLIQPFVPGLAASVSVLLGPGLTLPLPAGCQLLSSDGRFHYLGGEWPLPPPLDERARALALRAVAAVPGLTGYVGVDLVLGDAPDGSGDAVIEINPRLTTSYLGLRYLSRCNLASALLDVAEGREPAAWSWHAGSVRYDV